ncbi:hypothetical protein [Sorangium sp. So ce341]|uniref:hypothetical protein n=1 Tax=Sorangium sp. So ce341 TaxID=3133302 RepID=UPI003F5E3E91
MGFAALGLSWLGATSCLPRSDDDLGPGAGGAGGAGGGGGSSSVGSTSGSSVGSTSGSSVGSTSGSSVGNGSGAGGGDSETGSGGSPACVNDAYEENDAPASAAPLAYREGGTWFSRIDFVLCSGDEDWYLLDTTIGLEEVDWSLRVLAAGAELCGAACEEYTPPPGPENTVIVEVYSAATMELIESGQSDHGRVWLDGGGPDAANDLLLRVYGPPEAAYPYDITFAAGSDVGGDECEC